VVPRPLMGISHQPPSTSTPPSAVHRANDTEHLSRRCNSNSYSTNRSTELHQVPSTTCQAPVPITSNRRRRSSIRHPPLLRRNAQPAN
jgi:hypothetical protein